LGAFTSVIGDGGISIASSLDVPVTTGDAYTVSVAVQAVLDAANLLDIQVRRATAAVVGASGAIGKVCSELLSNEVAKLYLIGKSTDKLEHLKRRIANQTQVELVVSTEISDVKQAQLVLTVSSDAYSIIQAEHLRPGSVVCDVARPRDVSAKVAETRKDVLVIDGGVVDVPGDVKFNFDYGFPPGKAYACMAETMALTLEGRFEDYTIGKEIERRRVIEIAEIASKHGFRLNGYRSFEKPVTNAQIKEIRKYAYQAK